MESLEVVGYPIKVTNSSVFKVSFVTLVTSKGIIEVKINCLLESYKYSKWFDHCHLCQVFVVKSRNNWIIKEFLESKKIFEISNYQQWLLLSDTLLLFYQNFKKIDEDFLPLVIDISQNFQDLTLQDITKKIENYI